MRNVNLHEHSGAAGGPKHDERTGKLGTNQHSPLYENLQPLTFQSKHLLES